MCSLGYVSGVSSRLPFGLFSLHPSQSICAFAVGSIVVLWDFNVDKKIFLKGHEASVTCVLFSKDGKRLLTGDGLYLCLWDCFSSFVLMERIMLFDVEKHANSLGHDYESQGINKFDFCDGVDKFCMAFNGQVSLWQYYPQLEQIFSAPMTDDDPVIQVLSLLDDFSDDSMEEKGIIGRFITLQPYVMTFWKFSPDGLEIEVLDL